MLVESVIWRDMDEIPNRLPGVKLPTLADFEPGLLVIGAHYDPVSKTAVPSILSCPSKFDRVSGAFSRTVQILPKTIGVVGKVDPVLFRHRPIQVLFPESIVWCGIMELWVIPSHLYR